MIWERNLIFLIIHRSDPGLCAAEVHNAMIKSFVSLFWPCAPNRRCFAGANVLAGKRKWNENLSPFRTMYDKPRSLVAVCLPWQAPLSPAGGTNFSLYYENSFVDVRGEKKRKEKKNKTTALEQIIHHTQSGGAWKGICFDLVTKTKRLSLIAQMTQMGLGVKSNKSPLPSELDVNIGHRAPTCSSSRPWEMSLGPRKPGYTKANSMCLHVQTGPGARTNMFHKL